MALIASISGIRGTIGGSVGDNLTPVDIVKFAAAYGSWLKRHTDNHTVVLGRDARPSGDMLRSLVTGTLNALGISVIDLGLTTTPSVELAVVKQEAGGGIILTASHNPKEWNALKLLNDKGEFISAEDGRAILDLYKSEKFDFVAVDDIGKSREDYKYLQKHIDEVLGLPLVDAAKIKARDLHVAVDCVNSGGGVYVPALLHALGVDHVEELNCTPDGNFAHDPEPIAKNLTEICDYVKNNDCDLGIVVDPDVDRLALVSEDGELFGEEYTIVAIADYVLSHKSGAVVSNLSSSRALRDVAKQHGVEYHASAVGEVNVVENMKQVDAVIGGEGNGGVIYPASHYGRDALVGIGLFLSYLAISGKKMSELRAAYPNYYMCKHKVKLTPQLDVDKLLQRLQDKFSDEDITTIDGVKIDFDDSWVHLRKSNTEPIIRIYTEAKSQEDADTLAHKFEQELLGLM